MKDRINKEFLEAFKSKDTLRKNLLGVIKGEIQNEGLRTGKEVDVTAILKKMEKSLIQTNTVESLAELEILKDYLPVMMDGVAIGDIIYSYIQEGLNTVPLLMGRFNSEHKGKADNRLVMEIIKENL